MHKPLIIYGEPIASNFFEKLLSDKKSKYLTDFKRYFNYLKKHREDYKRCSIKDRVSIDKPLFDYVRIIDDWLEYETNGRYTVHINIDGQIYFGFKFVNPIGGDVICKMVKDWNKKKKLREEYFNWISKFYDSAEGPIFFSVY